MMGLEEGVAARKSSAWNGSASDLNIDSLLSVALLSL